jgi:hypothetical protein
MILLIQVEILKVDMLECFISTKMVRHKEQREIDRKTVRMESSNPRHKIKNVFEQ